MRRSPSIVLLMAACTLTGCGLTRPESLAPCAVVGGVAGAASGAAIGSSVDDNHEETNGAIGGAAGALIGALAGYGICALLPEKAPPPPKPAPAPAPVAKAPVVKKTVVLPGVHFAFDKADLAPAAKQTLDTEVVAELEADSNLRIEIEGYTDSVGTDSYNEALSQRRAESVQKYLASKGIAASRMIAKGFGEANPVADNSTKEGRAENRRVEIKVIE